jgi:hypothetical protein
MKNEKRVLMKRWMHNLNEEWDNWKNFKQLKRKRKERMKNK